MPVKAAANRMSADRGAADGRLAIFVTVCLVAVAVPGALVLHQLLLPRSPGAAASASGASLSPAGASAVLDSPGASSPPPGSSSAPASASAPVPPTPTSAPPAATLALPSLSYAVPGEPGYTVSVAPAGRVLAGVASLDLCLIKFASESRRVARLQVMYSDADGAGPALQVVMYRPGGAALAYNELVSGVKRCPTSYHEGPVQVTRVEVEPPDDSLLPSQLSIVQAATINGAAVWSSAIFQFDGPYMVIAYSNPYATKAAALQTAMDLARKVSSLLQRTTTGVPPTVIAD